MHLVRLTACISDPWPEAKVNYHLYDEFTQDDAQTSCTFVDTAPALDEITERLIQVLVFRRELQRARPFAPHSAIDLGTVGRAKDHSGKRFRLL